MGAFAAFIWKGPAHPEVEVATAMQLGARAPAPFGHGTAVK
jgi:hypothetical protein